MIIIAIVIGCILGAIIGIYAPIIPYTYSGYLAIGIMAALDSVFGGIKSVVQKNFDMKVFLAFQRVAFSDGVMETVMEKGNLDELFEEEQE